MSVKENMNQESKPDKFVLCRRDLGWPLKPGDYCAKPIVEQNNLNWCQECRAKLPLWP